METQKERELVRERMRGCLLVGAMGDALGRKAEFLSWEALKAEYGAGGVRELEKDGKTLKAPITDDTQMTLFTASGLLWADYLKKEKRDGRSYAECGILPSYLRWLYTQGWGEEDGSWLKLQNFERGQKTPILSVRELYEERGPGRACIVGLKSRQEKKMFDLTRKVNANSKGCGTVMRVAPVGLYFYRDPAAAYEEGKKSAAITHGHPTGQIAAGAFAEIIARVTGGEWLEEAIENVLKRVEGEERGGETASAVRLAVKLAESDAGTHASIAKLGEGWVAEEALAIALYCALTQRNSRKALIAAVNHDGDSDSTGAVCGNLLGAMYGMHGIPKDWLETVELRDFIEETADNLYQAVK